MRGRWQLAMVCVLLTAACNKSGSNAKGNVPDAMRTAAANACPPNFGNSLGSLSCCVHDEECQTRLESSAAQLRTRQSVSPSILVQARCETRDPSCPGPNYCNCVYTTGSGDQVTANALALGLAADCDVYGRTGECLAPAADAAGCDSGEVCGCAAQCARASARIAEDAARSLDVEARAARCRASQCQVVLRIEDRCYASFTPSPGAPTYDCALSDAEILDRAFPAPDAAAAKNVDEGLPHVVIGIPGACTIAVRVCTSCFATAPPLDCADRDGG